jgi:hypothetical protein
MLLYLTDTIICVIIINELLCLYILDKYCQLSFYYVPIFITNIFYLKPPFKVLFYFLHISYIYLFEFQPF